MKMHVLKETIETADPYKRFGKVNRVVGLMIESKGRRVRSVMYVSFIKKGASTIR